MDARDVILRPIITEASMYAMDNKKYTFEVNVRAKKFILKNLSKNYSMLKLIRLTLSTQLLSQNAWDAMKVTLKNVKKQS